MKHIIRRVLKEHIELREIHLNEIFLDSEFNSFLLSEGKATITYPKSLESDLKRYIENKYNWPPTIGNSWCTDIREKIDKKNNLVKYACKKNFTVEVTNHWIQRLFRSGEPDYKSGKYKDINIKNPSKTEGINLLFNSKNKINDFIDNSVNWVFPEEKYVLLSQGDYSTILVIKKELKGIYNIKLITQIKGTKFHDTPELKKTRNI
jgi:hypothetical protein